MKTIYILVFFGLVSCGSASAETHNANPAVPAWSLPSDEPIDGGAHCFISAGSVTCEAEQ